jgi:hypothetical protein
MKSVFLRCLDAADKGSALLGAVQGLTSAGSPRRFEIDPAAFAAVPKHPFVYWVSPSIRSLFVGLPRFDARGRTPKQGLASADDFRFLRHWWGPRVSRAEGRWFPFAKGGSFSPFYSDVYLAVNWGQEGSEIEGNLNEGGDVRSNVWMLKETIATHFFRPGLTWPRRPHLKGSFQVLPAGCMFGSDGPTAASADILPMSAVVNCSTFIFLLGLLMARGSAGGQTLKYEVGYVASTPVPDLTPADEAALGSLARRAWSLKRSLDTRTETSHAFVLPALLQTEGQTLATRSAAWTERVQGVEAELAEIQTEIDERCFVLYGISDEDRLAITGGFGGSSTDAETSDEDAGTDTDDEAEAEAAADTATLARELVSWAAGVASGRFDVRLATGERSVPSEPEPFDPLPVCSAAMLTGGDGLPLAAPPAGYPLTFPADGILVDDPGHPRDLSAAVRAVFDVAFGASADVIWQETSGLLDPKGHDLRTWIAKDFFAHHLARHSKSRRKAAILWQLGTPSGRYSTWLYAHRLTRDSLFALARDIVGPKLALEERRQASLLADAGSNPTAKQRAELETQAELVTELRTFDQEVRRVAPLWSPDLDDGIVLVEAPLWRLVPHKPWAKELKTRWDDLVAGKYDWAHLAMHLWPERVVPKCASDRSLAIAHGLEEVFWLEGTDGKWAKRARPTRTIDDLVAERTSPAVKAALADLLAAPAPAAGRGQK